MKPVDPVEILCITMGTLSVLLVGAMIAAVLATVLG